MVRCHAALCCWLVLAASATAADLILNEYNAVGSSRYLDADTYAESDKEDTYFATVPGLPDGRIQGNGGNWFELVVIQDHLDIRGWELRWAETASLSGDGTDLWFGDGSVDQGIISISPTADVWSDLRSGTIITVSELESIDVDTDFVGEDRNFTDGVSPAEADVTIDLATDTGYDPQSGDWWIHVSTMEETQRLDPLLTSVTNVSGDGPGNFSVGNDDWQLTIVDAGDNLIFGPVGEAVTLGGGVSSRNLFKLEGPVAPATLAQWQAITETDGLYNDGTSSSFGMPNLFTSGTAMQDFTPLHNQVLGGPLLGDLDCDGDVDFDDIPAFVLGLNDPVSYESQFGVPPTLKGDIDEDGDLDFDDIPGFAALLGGGGATPGGLLRLVPEPASAILWLISLSWAGISATGRRRWLGRHLRSSSDRAPWAEACSRTARPERI